MSLLKIKASWEEDDSTYRTIEMLATQSFFELHTCIKKSFELPVDMEASIFISNDRWTKEKEISSTIEKNLRDAIALSMKKTPIAALINDPHQKFLYESIHLKKWTFLLEIITLSPIPTLQKDYPICIDSEGISPSKFGTVKEEKDAVMDVLEMYDLDDKDGYGDEGEDNIESDEDEAMSDDSNFTDDL